MKRTNHILGGVALLVSLIGCKEDPAEKEVNLAWVGKGKCNSFFEICRSGAELAGEDLTSASGSKVNVTLYGWDDCSGTPTPAAGSDPCASDLQVPEFRKAMDSGAAGIAVDVVNATCLQPLIDEAVAAGTTVITFDNDAPDSDRVTYYGMDNEAAGKFAAQNLAALVGKKGKVAVQTYMTPDADGKLVLSTSKVFQDRLNAFEAEIAKYPDVEFLGTLPCTGTDIKDPACARELEAFLADNPDLVGVYMARGKLLRETGVADAAPNATAAIKDHSLRIVAMDAPADAIPNIKAGYADMVISPGLFGWGYDTMNMLYDSVTAGRAFDAFTKQDWDVVCANNVEVAEANYKAQDFRTPLPDCEL